MSAKTGDWNECVFEKKCSSILTAISLSTAALLQNVCCYNIVNEQHEQDAQLSQRDRAAGCVIVFTKSRRLELGDNILWTIYVYLQQL